MTLLVKIGLRIKSIREKSGLKQKELAKILALLPSTLSMYEQGKREPSISTIKKLSDHFNMSLSQFFIFEEIEYSKDKNSGYSIIVNGLREVLANLESNNLKYINPEILENSPTI
jgi:transcriptional regulator with XRE-family HTH domain